MKKHLVLSLLVLSLILPAQSWADAVLATDDFNRANGGLGANWTTQPAPIQNPQIRSNVLETNAVSGSNPSSAVYTAIGWPADQYSKARIVTLNGGVQHSVFVGVRSATAANESYRCNARGPLGATATLSILELPAGTVHATTGAAFTLAANDILECRVTGTAISLRINGVQILSATDSTLTGGGPGIGAFVASGGGTNGAQLDDWEGGSIGGSCGTRRLLGVGC